MTKTISCRHAGIAEQIMGREVICEWEGSAPAEEELADALIEHNRVAHGIDSMGPAGTVVAQIHGRTSEL